MKTVMILMAALTLCGCTKYWAHPSKSDNEFYADSATCESMSRGGSSQVQYAGGNPMAQGWNQAAAYDAGGSQTRIYENCMMGRGWREQ